MLSYLHSFHAGNFADVLKHFVQVEVLEYLHRKDKPFVYIDTHSAAGMYQLESAESGKNREYLTGIAKLDAKQWPELASYLALVEQGRAEHGETTYPGSPWFGWQMLREQDQGYLFELHPREFGSLEQLTYRERRIKARNEDGFQGLVALLPTKARRGLVLIDPPYEIKTDYQTVVETVEKAHRRMATATYAIWYPVVDRDRIDEMERQFRKTGIRNIQMFELGLQSDTEGRGMTSSGMLVVNPPFTLMQKMQDVLPRLAQHLGGSSGQFRCETLVEE
ncbi:23S rRNA (adenine(2030)-N(6))-methyltransferase RlmJ [Oceanobacter kriegii]|uniref:23S rRNA (adenine(2030)-N(6))-methyltransferase RlmJ n=1 Tax=Oceanobacter kriegii TaxID=64972 RepID=UPI00040DF346|nr:23S rRNA (adenine(2030)-N(6))-methyltransferase RlmJ [Oceanobacter kriegii]